MPNFINPFPGAVSRKLTDSELIRALRLDLAAEEEAVHLYTAHADATDNVLVKRLLKDIADEEIIHAGEFLHLIKSLSSNESELLNKGKQEVQKIIDELKKVSESYA